MTAPGPCRAGWAAAALAFAVACSPPADQQTSARRTEAEPVERVIALAPSAVETLCALDWCHLLVGVGSYVSHPPEVGDLPRLGGLLDADLERILLLEPDLVVLLESEVELVEKLTALDVEVLRVPSDSLADIGETARLVARRLGDPEHGAAWARELEAQLEPRKPEIDRRALLVVGRAMGVPSKLLIPGEDTYLGELVRRAGGEPALPGFGTSYREVDLATALASRPDVILEFGFESDLPAEQLAADWRAVYPDAEPMPCHRVIGGSHVVVPGPRVVELYRDIVAALEQCR